MKKFSFLISMFNLQDTQNTNIFMEFYTSKTVHNIKGNRRDANYKRERESERTS